MKQSAPEPLRLTPYERFTEQAGKQVEREKRPNCPKCGASDTLSHNKRRWLCGSCGKTWSKESPPEGSKSLELSESE